MNNKKLNQEVYYSKSDWLGNFLSRKRNNAVLKYIKGSLLDLGCGDGALQNSYKGESLGVDINKYSEGNVLIISNFESIPLESKQYDTITIIASLNYFNNVDKVLKEVNRLLKDNGSFILTMPNHKIMKIWHKFREPWSFKSGYSEKELIKLLNQNEFKLSNKEKFLFYLNNVYVFKKK